MVPVPTELSCPMNALNLLKILTLVYNVLMVTSLMSVVLLALLILKAFTAVKLTPIKTPANNASLNST